MHKNLPTFISGEWAVAEFRSSLLEGLSSSSTAMAVLRLYFYAVTAAGWDEISPSVAKWQKARKGRQVIAFIGTDHALTDPDALVAMRDGGIDVHLLTDYSGVYHPKVVWLSGTKEHRVWVGSNNLTRDGLSHNVEFATLVASTKLCPTLAEWARNVEASSTPLSEDLLKSYRTERNRYAKKRVSAGTFVWTKRKAKDGSHDDVPFPSGKGDLVLEVMPLETGMEGKQVQLPKKAAADFFGLKDDVGASKTVKLRSASSKMTRSLTMTIFANYSVRLSIAELDYRDRPCLIVFRKDTEGGYEFEIIGKAIFPAEYARLLAKCTKQTRAGSRRWAVLSGK